ncbi:hypothetical protein THRCLA_03737 [Thraustotheca clavata]|uniref:[phosphatase 2A protein]-leucine-carboxy methyltransferase n=1 Tax=Thraustotheca clavata TaxID=74557 RepID=A0A1W0A126_9STRA|nr:hypothetical protein THRCLA_03737 [Thraustotheca clavata]
MNFDKTSDHGVAETAYDAIHCKISAVKHGYFDDAFVECFEKKSTRRIPLIHRGYYLRHLAIEAVVDLFIQNRSTPIQILSLGAGFDTLFFRLIKNNVQNVSMFEIDCSAIVNQKIDILKMNMSKLFGNLFKCQEEMECFSATSTTSKFITAACDLGDLNTLEKCIKQHGFNAELPTLVLAECVLAYLAPLARSSLLQWASSTIKDATLVAYDPITLNSSFGAQLSSYFKAKGCTLRSVHSTIQEQEKQLIDLGWGSLRLYNMNAIYSVLAQPSERERMEKLEPFDEYEDWISCNHHYGFTVANNGGNLGSKVIQAWPIPPTVLGDIALANTYNNGYTIRLFHPDDGATVRNIFESTLLEYDSKSVRKLVAQYLHTEFMDMKTHYFSQPGSCFWVALVKDEIVGCVGVKPFKDNEAELVRLRVSPAGRRMGIASRLVETLEAYCRSAGYDSVYLETLGAMEAAQAFYARQGYKHIGTIRAGKPPADFALEQFHRDLHEK